VTWPTPRPGLVIRYSYLWKREADAGREEGVKDRPCAVVLAIEAAEGHSRVIVLPITHSPPRPPDEGIELPQPTKQRLRLDHERSWVVVSEANHFTWPGPDLRVLPGQEPASAAYGFLPPMVFRAIRERFLARYRQRKIDLIGRSE
jgi:hypothetical protein